MGFMKARFGGPDRTGPTAYGVGGRAPGWCDFFGRNEYRAFREVVDSELRSEGRAVRELGGGRLAVDEVVVALHNLAQKCAAASRQDWPRVVGEHFAAVWSLAGTFEEPSFDEVESRLKVRLYNRRGIPEEMRAELVTRELAEGLFAALVIDSPTSVVSVPAPWAADWGRGTDELFRIALANVRLQERPRIDRMEVDGGGTLSVLLGSGPFTATWLLMLDEFAGAAPVHGALVAVPNRHVLLYVPIVDATAMSTARVALELAADLYRTGPGSISPYLYWRREGSVTFLPARLEGRRAVIAPPPEFLEALAAVGF